MKDLKTTLQAILSHYSPEEQAKITYAYRMAENAMKDKLRENRHPFIEHPLGVAQIIAEDLCLGADSVIALFLHETLRFYPEALETVPKGTFSEEVLNIALNLNKIALIKPKETRLEAENYKRLILSYSKDPRVTLVKLADRLDVMRNIRLLSKSSQERKVTETMLLYIPIAHQLGLYNLKSELENIFFKCTEPEKYREISNKLSATEGERAMLVKSFIEPLKQKISEAGIKATFKQRTKCAYSIWKKMQKQGVPFEGVKDLLAIRIIIDAPDNREEEVALCWNAYSIVTEQYIPDLSRLRDWLSKPKSNGYESLHITVSDASGRSLEVQIRTDRMDRIAEKGHASHWSYKGVKEEREVAGWLNSVRETLEKGAICYEYQSKYLKEEVFVFTPDGALRRLPKGATILDFAFDIHTNLGIRCSGALVDGKPAQIKEELHTGEVIEIKTSKKQKPSVDWLSFVVTSKARNKIRLKLKEEALKKSQAGRELLERRLKNWKEVMNDEDIMVFIKKYKLKSISDFYEAIENESIDLMTIKNFLANKYHNTEESPGSKSKESGNGLQPAQTKKADDDDFLYIDGNLDNIGYKMARCCNPIFGDDVFAFVSAKEGIKIHRISCPNAKRLIENYPYRIHKVKWKSSIEGGSFQTTIKAVVDDTATYSAILDMIQSFGASIRSSSVQPAEGRANKGRFIVKCQVYLSNNQVLDKILSNMRKNRGVSSAQRVSK